MSTTYLLIALFFTAPDGVPKMEYTEVIGTHASCKEAAARAIQPVIELVGEKNIISMSCVKKYPDAPVTKEGKPFAYAY